MPTSEPIQVLSLKVKDYTASKVYIHVTGTVQLSDISTLDTLEFFEDSKCEGKVIGSVLTKNFKTNGVDLELQSNQSKNLYLATQNSLDCIYFMNYKKELLKPSEPKFFKTAPESPTRETASPGIYGSAFPNSGSINFYNDTECTNKIGQGSIDQYSGLGIQIYLDTNQTSTIYGVVEDLLGQSSGCTELTTYTHLDTVITNPVFTSTVPISPNNVSNTPLIKGSLAVEAVNVTIYDDSACSNPLVTGTPEDFSDPGLQVILPSNSVTNLYAKSIDGLGNPSACALLTTYIHDLLPPDPPAYNSIDPISPNNNNLFPKVAGTSSSDTLTVKFYDSSLCLVQIGAGSKTMFDGSGVAAGVGNNATTSIYAQSFDPAGNASNCTFMTDYKHNTIPPNFPIFSGTNPSSPNNNNLNPLIYGTVAEFTYSMEFYNDENCVNLIGAGTPADFEGAGISLTMQANTSNSIYVKVRDLEGNWSNCGFHASYDHSNTPAPNPSISYTFPPSPTNGSNIPFLMGTADVSITSVTLYDSSTCSNPLGSGSRGQFISAGIQVTLPSNSTTDIYAIARDIYGNDSSCGFLTQFIHNTINPDDPVFIATVPVSPNATSTNPFIQGTATTPVASQLSPFLVSFYDTVACVNKLGEGTPAEFSSGGIDILVPGDSTTNIYSRVFDEAGNGSNCTPLTDYTHDSYKPGTPIFVSATPQSPSYSRDIKIKGVFGASPDFLSRTSVGIYSDSSCSNLITSGSPTDYEGVGIDITVAANTTTSLYAASVNEVNTMSNCQLQTHFAHDDAPPQNLAVSSNFNGGVYLNWLPDLNSSPIPTYTVERSLSATGPFSIIQSGSTSNNYTDNLVSDGETYYYRVYSSNNTGRSQYSTVENITVSVGAAVQASTLNAYPGSEEVRLSWGANVNNMTYKIYRATQPGGPYTQLPVEVSNSQYLDETVVNNSTYYYVVTGSNPAGESLQSNMASAYPRPLPSPPTDLKIVGYPQHPDCAFAQGIQLSWTPSSYYDTFAIMRGNDFGANTQVASTSQSSQTFCLLTDGNNYSFAIAALWGSKKSDNSDLVYYRWTNPTTLSLFPGVNEVRLKWTEPDGGNLYSNSSAEYNVYRSSSIEGPFTKIADKLSTLSYVDNTASNNSPYYYFVETELTLPNGHRYFIGSRSLVKSAVPTSLPANPSNLSIVNNLTTSALELHWSSPSHFNSFNIYHSNNLGGPYIAVANVVSSLMPAAPVSEGMNYFYVKGVWGGAETGATNIVSYRKATISGFTLTPSASEISLNWNAVVGAQTYKVLRASQIKGPYTEIATAVSNSYIDSTAVTNTGYFYKVYATFSDATQGQPSTPKGGMITGTNFPGAVSLEVISSTSLKVNWVPGPTASSHKIYASSSVGGPWTLKATLPSGSETLVSGLAANSESFIKVAAVVGATEYDAPIESAYTYGIPQAPYGSVGNNQINLSWTPVTAATNYDLLRSPDGTNFSAIASNHPTSSFLDLGVVSGQIYFYKVRANFAMGSTVSNASLSFTPGVTPLAPVQLEVKNTGSGTDLELSWSKVDGAVSYNVYVDTNSSHTVPFMVSSTHQNLVISGLSLDTVYYLAVSAKNGDLESSLSPEVRVVTSLEPPAPNVSWASSSSLDISWVTVSGASTYDIFRSLDGIGFELLSSGISSLTFNDSTVDPSKTYFYKYLPRNSNGYSMALSAVSTPIVIGVLPEPPEGFLAEAYDNNSIILNWIGSSTASSYQVMRSTSSGGPYTLLNSVAAPTATFIDSSVSAGTSYFYVVKAVNIRDVASENSQEVGINLNGSPLNLIGSNTSTGIQLDWDLLAGAVSYKIGRAETSGGPFGIIGSSGTNSFIDNLAEADTSYFYVVFGEFVGGTISPYSNEINVNRVGSLNLQVPIEMIDTRLSSSNLGSLTFERSKTSLNTDDYDGVANYEFEVIAKNTDGSAIDVFLVDAGDVEIGSLSIPSNTMDYKRIKSIFTPSVGAGTYRIKIASTTLSSQVEIYSARILVNQVGATKTKLYFPLLSVSQFPSSGDISVAVHSTSSQSYEVPLQGLPYLREVNDMQSLPDYNAWELEALVSVTGSAEGSFALVNRNSGIAISGSQTLFSQNVVTLAKVPIDEGVDQFSPVNESELYDFSLKCEFNLRA